MVKEERKGGGRIGGEEEEMGEGGEVEEEII